MATAREPLDRAPLQGWAARRAPASLPQVRAAAWVPAAPWPRVALYVPAAPSVPAARRLHPLRNRRPVLPKILPEAARYLTNRRARRVGKRAPPLPLKRSRLRPGRSLFIPRTEISIS